jgi:DNA topoisomerase I
MTTLVIVESPTKARTIRNFLPSDYIVEASMGHVRDLPNSAEDIPEEVKGKPWANLAVNVENNFEPVYIIPKEKKKVVEQLKKALKQADELILATDEDREGESISWHLLQVLKPKMPIKRMVFHEITKEAIQSALKQCRNIDESVVRAQETRRILDRLVGYTISPLLWKKISWGLSAGRVQSVAVRLLVIREKERRAFCSATYWDLKALLQHKKSNFESKLITVDGVKVAIGSDFNPDTGKLIKGKKVKLLTEAEARQLATVIKDKTWTVADIEEKPLTRKPSPPFTTSTLQQESNRKLRLSAKETMKIAQSLYEQGYITYMRTDSVHLSDQAIIAARECVEKKYGQEYLSPQPRQYTTKSKGAQEAHEAIRPAGNSFRTPQETGLSGKELNLYDLIWKRTIASQMADSKQTSIIVNIQVENAGFRSTGKRIDFPGFLRAYVEGSDDPEAALEDQEVILPDLKKGDHPDCKQVTPLSHETQPPARFTEASLVKTLEAEGIGRPSTYATIISTIVDREYAQIINNALIPTFTAFAVTNLLENHFNELVDTSFTSKMEQTLDDIAEGKTDYLPYLRNFYAGEKGLDTLVKKGETEIDASQAKTLELLGLNAKVKIGKFGPYVEAETPEGIVTSSIPKDATPADFNMEQVELLLKQKTEGPESIGTDPETQKPIYVLVGNYGPYIQLGNAIEGEKKKPKRVALPKGMKAEEVSLKVALDLLSLPRNLGTHPETQGKIQASIGPFGAYVLHDQGKDNKDYRSLKVTDDVLTISLERALEILAQPKKARTTKTKEPLKVLGNHPEDGEPLNIYDGKYGIYINHKKTNVTLPEGENVDNMTLEKALKLLAAKAGTKKKATTKTGDETTKKTTTKKTTSSKSTKKKTSSD